MSMSETVHDEHHWELAGLDIYAWNFIVLMIFTVIEVGAVYIDMHDIFGVSYSTERYLTWVILIGVGIIKGYGIAAFFMHLRGDPGIYTQTAVFPVIFLLIMILGIGLSSPNGVEGLPAWCTPFADGYLTQR